MKQKIISTQNLAKIERILFKSVQQNKTDLSPGFDSSDLFINIKRKIYLEQPEISHNKKRLWLMGYGFASVLILGFLLISAFYFVNFPSKIVDESVSITQSEGAFQPIEEAQPSSENNPQRFVENKKTKSINRPQMIVKKQIKSLLKPVESKKNPFKKMTSLKNSSPFYAIGSVEYYSPDDVISIVRANFSKTELLAMGVEVLNDIGDSLVEAEVIIGNDGQPRAIRILK